MKLIFKNTCTGCPEQYDVYNTEGHQIGYIRLRHGYLSVRCPNSGGVEVYGVDTKGDGTFYDAFEREFHLTKAAESIKDYLTNKEGVDYDYPSNYVMEV